MLKQLGKKLSELFVGKKLTPETIEKIEELLMGADIAPNDAIELCEHIASLPAETTLSNIKDLLFQKISTVLQSAEKEIDFKEKPTVILLAGTNGAGKTTTLYKLASLFKKRGKTVLVAGCDSFRAGALEQLKNKLDTLDIEVVGEAKKDPSAIAYQVLQKAISEKTDILFIDTAGRLHDNENLMAELSKINRVLQKQGDISLNNWLVLDGTSGQNTLAQIESYSKTLPLTGLIITKLDSSSKAGFVYSLQKRFSLPLFFIGIGEKETDLVQFNANAFTKELLE